MELRDSWQGDRSEQRKRDENTCQHCGTSTGPPGWSFTRHGPYSSIITNSFYSKKLSAGARTGKLQQPADVEHGVGDEHADDDRVGEDGVPGLEKVGGDSGHKEHEERKRYEEKH